MLKDRSHFEQFGETIFHDHWVVAVTSLPAGAHKAFPDGCIITGCMDSKIRIFDSIGNPLHEIQGHEKGVISFSWTSKGELISGSWDGTARIWSLELSSMTETVQSECKFVLGSHENGVHVLGLPDGRVVTTSTGESVNEKPANFKVRIWDGSTGALLQPAIVDHTGPIRSVCLLPGMGGFATCSNDGSVIMRTGDGAAVSTSFQPPQEDGSPPFLLDW